jgi:hypothetical protein
MLFGDLSQTLATLTVLLDGEVVQYQRSPADPLTFETSTPHAGAHPFDDQAAFQLGDRADDYDCFSGYTGDKFLLVTHHQKR